MRAARCSVWAVAQRAGRHQRAGRYRAESLLHPAKMLPALARTVIETYTEPGDVVVDPMCGIGTTIIEALHLGRDGYGVEYEPHWATLARGNVAFARTRGAGGRGVIVNGDCRHLRALLPAGLVGQVRLVLTSPPYGPTTHGLLRWEAGRGTKVEHRYSRDQANLAYVGTSALLGALQDSLQQGRRLL